MNKIAPLFKFGRATSKQSAKINVAYIALAPFISGSERSLQVTIAQISKMGIGILLICPKASPLLAWAKQNNIRFESCELKSLSADRHFLPSLYAQLRLCYLFYKYKINIAHSNQIWSYPAMYWPAKLAGCSLVCHLRDPVEESINWWMKRRPHAVVCVSQYLKAQFQQHYKNVNNIKTVNAFINPVFIPPKLSHSQRNCLRHNACTVFGVSPDKIVFGFIGQISPVKGVIEMLGILSQIPHSNWQLLIAGNDPSHEQNYMDKCIQLAQSLGIEEHVRFIGYQQEVSNFYHATDCILMFSKREPLGRVPLEAGAYYTPSIVSNVDGLPETINDHKSGFLVSMNEQGNISSLLASITLKQCQTMGEEARRFVELNAETRKYTQNMLDIYQTLSTKQSDEN
jgi:glycosyltransferase involved in cell wall biosynthesis